MGGLASSVGSMVGIGGSAAAQGMNWNPSGAGLSLPTTSQQVTDAYNASQTGINNQASFLQALQGQNGIANQSSVYNQLQGVANGTGPNPAQAMLAQSTGANTANQAALMAGQRGAGANAGLIARQAAQQGGANQQAAAGQAATMQANQSLNALGQLSGIAGQQVGQQAAATGALTGAQQSEQQLLLNSLQGQNAALVQQQTGLNQANLAQAQSGAKAQAGVLQGIGQGIGMAKGGRVPHYANGTPNAPVQPSGAPSAPPAPTKFARATSTALGANDVVPGQQQDAMTQSGQAVGQGIGKGIAGLGGAIKGLFGSGSTPGVTATGEQAPDSSQPGDMSSSQMDMSGIQAGGAAGGMEFAKGGKVPAMVSPGERYLNPREVQKVAKGEKPAAKAGEKIPGKAKVKGDSLKNDIVPKTLEEGGIVLPRSVMESKHPHWEAHKFVSAILKKQGGLHSKKK